MRPLRNLVNELVERRLWPVALLLLLALAAVPLLLSKPASSADEGTTPAAAPAAVAAAARAPRDTPPGGEPVVSVAQTQEPNARLRGHAKNPFRQQHLAAEPRTSVSAASTSGGPSGGSQAPGSTGGSGPTQPSTQPVRTYWYPSIDVRFGTPGRSLHAIEDLPPLAALPRAQKPVVIFLGVSRRDPSLAGFLVSSDVHVQGTYARACYPDRHPCLVIALRRGDVVFFDYREADGTVVQYELDLVDLSRRVTDSLAKANAAYARSSRIGRRTLRRAARQARARHASVAQAVTGTAPGAPSLEPLP